MPIPRTVHPDSHPSPDSAVVGKALAAACSSVRDGGSADAFEGVTPSFVASPESTEEAAAVVRVAAEHDLAVVPRGSGSRLGSGSHLGWGMPPGRADLVVETLRMDKVLEHAAGDLVVRVQAGARMGDLAEVLAAAGQEVALDVPVASTAGGMVATGLAGPRRLRYGSPRDLLIGITIVRADGTVAKSGGKVVKNVAGYDLGKLFAGSWGTLGLITEVTFRLHPLPGARAYVTASFADAQAACVAVAGAAASPLVPSAVELGRSAPGGPLQVGVLLEGSADGVAARAERMAGLLAEAGAGSGAGSASIFADTPSWWPGAPAADGGTLIQVSFWVSALASVLGVIDEAARSLDVTATISGAAGAGVLYVALPADVAADVSARFVGALRRTLSHERGHVVVLAAPAAVRTALGEHGGMTGPVPSVRLMRAVKDQFDPGGRLSPGRFPAEGA
jgi:glycolate oxidase FAD binding subunit